MVPSNRNVVLRSPSQSSTPENANSTAIAANVVEIEALKLAAGLAQSAAVAREDDDEQSQPPADRDAQVHRLDQRPTTDSIRERGNVEHEPGREKAEERRRVEPVPSRSVREKRRTNPVLSIAV